MVSSLSTETADAVYDLSLRTYDIHDKVNDNYSVATAGGDFNGDGASDLAVGLPLSGTNKNHSGKVYIFYGNSSQTGPDLILYGEADGDRFGAALAATDMNNDGADELIVGAPDSDIELTYPVIGTEYDAGKAYVYTGGANLNTTALTTFEGQWTQYLLGENLGWSVAAVGDINGDGFNDVAVGGPYGGENHHGRVIVIYGGASYIGGTNGLLGPNVETLLGTGLAAAGDVNNDGYADFLIAGDEEANKVYLVLGDTTSHVLNPIQFPYSNHNYYFTDKFALAGSDINGDGFSDLIIGDSIYFGSSAMDNTRDILFGGGKGPYRPLGDPDTDGFQDLFLGDAILWGGNSVSTVPVSVNSPTGYHDMDNDGLVDVLVHDSAAEQIRVNHLKPYINAPKIIIETPQNSSTFDPAVVISGYVNGNCSRFSVAGQEVTLTAEGHFSQIVYLRHGNNNIELVGLSAEGYVGKKVLSIYSAAAVLSVEIDTALSLDAGAGLLRIAGHTNHDAAHVDVNGVSATLNGNNFTADITVTGPDTTITVTAVDNVEVSATDSIAAALLMQGTDAAVAGLVKNPAGEPMAGVTVTMQDAAGSHSVSTGSDGTYSISTANFGDVTVAYSYPGFIEKTVTATLSTGLTAIVDSVLIPIPALSLYIYSPEDNSTLAASQVTVEGSCSHDDIASVTVNGVAAELIGPESYFKATIPLNQGVNTISITANDIYNQTATTSITVTATPPPPNVSFSAAPAAIDLGATSTLSWNVTDADTVSIDQNIGDIGSSGTLDVSPAGTTTYTLTATGPGGTTTRSVTVTVLQLPVVSFTAAPDQIRPTESSTLSWNVSWADTVSIDNNIGAVAFSGTLDVSPAGTTTYTLTATGPGGTTTAAVTVTVSDPPYAWMEADPLTINAGDCALLNWVCSNAVTCSITPDVGDVQPSGTQLVWPKETTTYTITATNAEGSTSTGVVVNVVVAPTLTADRIIIDKGESVTLRWNSTSGESCEITPDIGTVPFNGELAVSPQESTLYTLTLHKDGLAAKAYVRIYVRNGTYYGNPTPAEQAHIEAINRARANPTAEAARFSIDLNEGPPSEPIGTDPVQPLACSVKLLESARLHAQDMIDNQYYSHDSLDGRTFQERIEDTGFWYLEAAENIAQAGDNRNPFDELEIALRFHEALFVDSDTPGRGHRINILNPDLKEVGVGLSRGPADPMAFAYGAKFTCDFGTSQDEMRSFLLGVVYDDLDGDGQYTAGEGLGDAQILIVENNATTVSASAGGYRIPLTPGDYTVRATLPDGRQFEKNFTISDQNVKVDFDLTPLPVIAFNATPGQFIPGEPVSLAWTVTGADSCQITPDIGTVLPSGSTQVSPTQETTYTLTATGPGGTTSKSVTLTTKTPVVVFTADPRGIAGGDNATLSWNVTGADTVSIDQGIGTVAAADTRQVSPAATTTYTLTAQGPGGTTTASATVWFDTEAPAVIDITPAGGTVAESQSGWVTYSATVQDNASGLCSVTLLDDQGADVSNLLEINGSEISWVYSGGGSAAFTLILEDCAGNSDSIAVNNTIIIAPRDVDYGYDAQAGPDFAGGNIRITNGNVVEARSDVAVTTPNQSGLGFGAFYNSRSTAVTALGYGWTHTYSATLTGNVSLGGQTFIRIVDATGRARYFSDTSPYSPAFNEKSQLTVQSGQYIWQRLGGSRCGFNPDGTLDWIDDAAGNRLELAYDAGQLQTVTDTASGRSLSFNHNGGRLVSVGGPVTAAVPDGVWVRFEHDSNQNLVSATYADGSAIVYTYAGPYDPHNLTGKEDGVGHQLAAWDYDDQDRAYQSRMPDDSSVQIDYLSPERVQVTDAYGTLRTYDLAQIHGRIKVTRLQGPAAAPYYDTPAVRWQYDDHLNLTEVEMAGGTADSPMNTIHRYEDFDDRGNAGTLIQAWNTIEERTIVLTYHPVLNAVLTRTEASVMDEAQDKETIYDYDDPADPGDDPDIYNQNPTNLVRRIIEKGLTAGVGGSVQAYTYITTLSYNARGQVLSSDGPLAAAGDTTAYAYDPDTGDLTSVSRPLVGDTTFSDHDAAGRLRTITDINGVARSLTYDGRGRLVETLNQADGSTQSATYGNGLLTQRTDAEGITQSVSYEAAYGRPDTITDHQGHTTVFGYDSYGNRTDQWRFAADDPSTPTTSARWSYDHPDLPGRLYRAFSPDPNQPGQDVYTQYDYDLAGNTAAVTDPKGQVTGYVYDSLNRAIEISQPGGGTTTMEYDAHGNLSAVTDAEGRRSDYLYDDMDRKVSESSPDAGTTTYAFDAAGSLVGTIDGRGVAVAYTPDELGRTRRIHYPLYDGRPAYAVTYTYDDGPGGHGRLTAMTDASGSTSWDYGLFDAQGIVTQTTVIEGFAFIVTETRTPGGRRTRLVYPSTRAVDYQRSQCACAVSGITTTYGADTATLLAGVEYQPSGMPKAMDIGDSGAANVDNRYDEAGRLTAANPDTPNARTYSHDANGNTVNIRLAAAPWQGQSYTYDALNRITGAVGDFGFIDMTYDLTGNRLTRTHNGAQSVYDYAPGTSRLERLTPAGGSAVNYTYDGHGNMILAGSRVFAYDQANRLAAVSEGGSAIGQYIYNGLGQRVVKTTDAGTTYYHYDPAGKLIAETPAGGAVDRGTEYIYKGNGLLAQVDVQNGPIYTYHTNYLGAAHQLTDHNGTVVWEAVYQPFGQTVINAGSTVVNNWRMPGQYHDEETGLSYNYHRYYDPALGRYLTPDPIGLEGGINLYAYVQNNPVNWIDPSGLSGLAIQYYANFLIATPRSEENCEDIRQAGNDIDRFFKFWFSGQNIKTIAKMFMALNDPGSIVYLNETSDSGEKSDINDEDLADDIAEHARKHNPRIPTDELSELIKDTINRGEKKDLDRGRRAYYDPLTGRVVVVDPSSPDKGTSLMPERGRAWFDDLE